MKPADLLAAAVEIEHSAQALRELGDQATQTDVHRAAAAVARYKQLTHDARSEAAEVVA